MQEGSLDLQRYKFITVYSSYNLLYKKNIKLGDIAFDTIRFAMLAQLLLYSYGGDTNMHWTAAFINYKYIITSLKFSTISSTIIIRWGSITETVHPIEVRHFYLFWIVLRLKILRPAPPWNIHNSRAFLLCFTGWAIQYNGLGEDGNTIGVLRAILMPDDQGGNTKGYIEFGVPHLTSLHINIV